MFEEKFFSLTFIYFSKSIKQISRIVVTGSGEQGFHFLQAPAFGFRQNEVKDDEAHASNAGVHVKSALKKRKVIKKGIKSSAVGRDICRSRHLSIATFDNLGKYFKVA